MTTIHTDRSDKMIDQIANAVGYGGRTVQIKVAETVSIQGDYWSGGSKNSFYLVNFADMRVGAVPGRNPLRDATSFDVDVPVNGAIVEHVYFQGKDLGIRIYVRAETAAPLLPAKVELTPEEKKVLEVTRSYKSSYGGIKNYRQHESGLSEEVYAAAKASLQARGLLDKRGAITNEGRNAVGSKY